MFLHEQSTSISSVIFVSFGFISRNVMVDYMIALFFKFLRKLHIASHNSQTKLDSDQQFPGVLSSPDPEPVCFISCHFDDGHSKRDEVISCYSFDSIFLLRRHLSSIMSINQKGAKREKCRALQIYQEVNIFLHPWINNGECIKIKIIFKQTKLEIIHAILIHCFCMAVTFKAQIFFLQLQFSLRGTPNNVT